MIALRAEARRRHSIVRVKAAWFKANTPHETWNNEGFRDFYVNIEGKISFGETTAEATLKECLTMLKARYLIKWSDIESIVLIETPGGKLTNQQLL